LLFNLTKLVWDSPRSLSFQSNLWLIHYPTNIDENDSTFRLYHPVFPTISEGKIISFDVSMCTFDSTIVATGGSSGGIIVNEFGLSLGVHDSQHNENPLGPLGTLVSTHRAIAEIREITKSVRQLNDLFADVNFLQALLIYINNYVKHFGGVIKYIERQ